MENEKIKERYLGDGVYIKFDEPDFIIYTSDGITNKNIIVLEPSVINSFLDFIKDC